jgi:hypothetical protein
MKRASTSDRLQRSPIHLLHRAGQCAGDIFHAEMMHGELTPRQFAVLYTVANNQRILEGLPGKQREQFMNELQSIVDTLQRLAPGR